MNKLTKILRYHGEKEVQKRISNHIKKTKDGCWLWQGTKKADGCGVIVFQIKGVRYQMLAHRVAYAAWEGNVRQHLMIRHECNNRECVNPEHLSLGTAMDNNLDTSKAGRLARGVKHPRALANPAMVREIRRRAKTTKDEYGNTIKGESGRSIAKEFPLSEDAVRAIINRSTWKHVKEEE